MGTPGLPCQPQLGCLGCGRVQAPHSPKEDASALISSLHMSLQLFLKASGPLPQPPALVSLRVFSFPRAGSCSRVPVSYPDSVSPHLDQGITFTFVWVCWVAAETLVTGTVGETCRSHSPSGDGPGSFSEQQDEDPFYWAYHG